ncbi:hypothetical protein [Nocardia sp. NPDC049149]|uniref:hypothetical protein n=1 Tax=Nocardia sp. NPDC049149 TaxID=3364315 RepID=UPI00371B2081
MHIHPPLDHRGILTHPLPQSVPQFRRHRLRRIHRVTDRYPAVLDLGGHVATHGVTDQSARVRACLLRPVGQPLGPRHLKLHRGTQLRR